MDYLAAGLFILVMLSALPIITAIRWEYGLALTLSSLSLMNRLKTEYFLELEYILITAESICIFLLLTAFLLRFAVYPKLSKIVSPLIVPVVILVSSGVLSLLNSVDMRVSLRLLAAGVLQPVMLFYIIVNTIEDIRQVRLLVAALIVSAVVATVYGLWQVFLTFTGSGSAFDYRIVSMFYSPAIFGEVLLLSFPLVLVMRITYPRTRRAVSLLLDVVIALMIIAMLMTITRSVWLGLLVSIAVLLIRKKIRSYLFWRLSVVIFVLMILVIQFNIVSDFSGLLELFQRRPASIADFTDNTTSIGERVFAWGTALEMMLENPIGIGLGMFSRNWSLFRPLSADLEAAHNLFLDIGVQIGVVGLLAFVWILINSIRICVRLAESSQDSDISSMALGILSGIAGYCAHAFAGGAELAHNDLNVTSTPLGSPISTGMLIFWTLIGLIFVLGKLERNSSGAFLSKNVVVFR